MESTTLGSTRLIVSRIGLGLAALGRPGYINLGHGDDLSEGREVASMEARAHEVLDAAWAEGVRYFDAARSYGRAEAFLASWLDSRAIEPGTAIIGSKWGYTYTADWAVEADRHEVKDHSTATLVRQSAESRATLGRFLNLYQIHSATLESGVLGDRAILHELGRLRDGGWTIGLSTTGPRQSETIRRAMAVEVDGDRLFGCVQATWNLLEPSAGPALEEAHAAGLGVIVKEALANGRLTPRNHDPSFVTRRAALERVVSHLGTSLDALAITAVLARPWVDVVLSGAATTAQLRSNLAAASIRWDEAIEAMIPPLTESPEEYWAFRSRLPWN